MLVADDFELEELANEIRDDLQIKEVQIWDYVSESYSSYKPWKMVQEKYYYIKNYIVTVSTIYSLLHLSADEVLNSNKPYKKILNKQLWKDIDYRIQKYKLLILQKITHIDLNRSEDGFVLQTLVDICNGHAVAEVNGTDEILGGHNPLEWDNRNTFNGLKFLAK
ncbi:hypothetical protein Glove_606g71 [Diversispora epigaea]|uniref:Uncharacterized protein n=1 Tax=Diversispora epigaea TaxID=1348612 RepID=A0A397G765_9GLOM|nr:hypothetical protein Glove_606g71 [Diversispora epigaea]